MTKSNETVEDIITMLRRFACGKELPTDDMPSFTSFADRLETALENSKRKGIESQFMQFKA